MVVRTDANAATAEYGRELGGVAVAVAMGETVRLTDAEVDAIVHGDRPVGMGEQPSIINRDPGDENRALVLPQPSKTLLELIQGLEATIAGIRADLDRLMATPPAPSTAPTPPPHNPMANALAHSEPKPAWQR